MHTTWLIAAAAALSLHLLRAAPPPAMDRHSAATRAGAVETAAPAQTQNLLRLEPFIGGRWIADGVLSGGHRYTAERRYEWFMDRRFIRIHQRLTVDSVTVNEEGVIGWDASSNELRFWSFASDGSFAEGRERPATGDNRWVFEGRTVGGRGGEWRITTLLVDPSSFSVLLEVRAGDDLQPVMTLAYHRIAEPADTTPAPDTTAVRIDTTRWTGTGTRRSTVSRGAISGSLLVASSVSFPALTDWDRDSVGSRSPPLLYRRRRGEVTLVVYRTRLYIPRHGRTYRTHGPEAADPPDAALARRRLSV